MWKFGGELSLVGRPTEITEMENILYFTNNIHSSQRCNIEYTRREPGKEHSFESSDGFYKNVKIVSA